jgi:PAS domain S-box-containing protein
MTGFDLARELRARPAGAAVPIVVISGFLSQMEQARSMQVGFTDFLFKPVEPSHLLRTIQAYLRPGGGVPGKSGQGRRILIADDDPVQLKLLKIQLEHQGFQVTTAQDGEDALEQARLAPPDALVSDVLMPRLDGFRLCLAVRQDSRLGRLPVILTSAVYTEELDQQLSRKVGANAFILRTSDHREVIETLQAVLGGVSTWQPAQAGAAELPLEQYTHRVIRQLEHHVELTVNLTHRLALLEAELGILARIVETLKNRPVVETVLQEMLYRCLHAAGISRGAAYLLAADGRLSLSASLGYQSAFEEPLANFFGHTDLLHHVLAEGEPIEVRAGSSPNAPLAAGADRRDLLNKAGAQSMLLAPLVLGEERLGVLGMASASRELGADWLSFAKAVGSQITQAIELARTLEQLRTSEQRCRDLVHHTKAIVWEAEVSGRFTFVNQYAEHVLGYPVSRWLTEADFQVNHLHPEDQKRIIDLRRQAVAQGHDHVLEYRMFAADGRIVWLHDTVGVSLDAGGRPCHLRGVMVDISERKQAEDHAAKLRLAREIQRRLFPSSCAGVPGFDVGGASYPAEATGGDYFDYFPLSNGCLAIAIGDVSGHGFGPALLMAELRAYLRALTRSHTDVGEIVTLLNRALISDMAEDHFVTLLLGQLEPGTRTFRYISAGHQRCYVLGASGNVKQILESTAPPIGIDPSISYATSEAIDLAPGDLVLLLTDGIVEARDPNGALFRNERALNVVQVYRNDPARRLVENLYHAVRAFSQNQIQADDITAVVLKVQSPA